MKRFTSVALGLLLGGFLVLGVVPGSATPAAALQGCMSSIDPRCSPGAAYHLAYFAGQGNTAAVSTTATVTTSVTGVGASSASVAASAALATGVGVGLVGYEAGYWLRADPEVPWPSDLPLSEPVPAGWVGGNVTTTESTAYGYRKQTHQVEVVEAPPYGQSGVVTIRTRCLANEGTGMGTLDRPLVRSTSGAHLYTFHYPGSCSTGQWAVASTTITGSFGDIRVAGSPVITWRPVDHPAGSPEGSTGGQFEVTSMVACSNGVDIPRLVQETATFTYEPGAVFDYPRPQCGPGEVVFGYGIVSGDTDIVPWTETPEWVQNVPLEWPGCLDSQCELSLWQATSGGKIDYCGKAALGCPSWYTQVQTNPGTYECRWGEYVVDLGYCNVYRQPGRVLPNTGVQFDEATRTWTTTGAGPITDLTLDPNPELGSAFRPWDDELPDLAPGGGAANPTGGECFPEGWGVFNPVEWVYKPVVCALKWAFMPSVMPDTSPIMEAIDGTVVGEVTGFFNALPVIFDGYGAGSASCGTVLDESLETLQGNRLFITTCDPLILSLAPLIRASLMGILWVGGTLISVDLVLRGFDIHILASRIDDKAD